MAEIRQEKTTFENRGDNASQTLGQRLHALRIKSRLPLQEAAVGAGLGYFELLQMEADQAIPSNQEIHVLSIFYGVTEDYLIKGEST